VFFEGQGIDYLQVGNIFQREKKKEACQDEERRRKVHIPSKESSSSVVSSINERERA